MEMRTTSTTSFTHSYHDVFNLAQKDTSGLGTGQIVQSFFVLLAFIVVALCYYG